MNVLFNMKTNLFLDKYSNSSKIETCILVHKDYYYQENFIQEIPNQKGVSDAKSAIL